MESRNKATSMDIQAVSPMSKDIPFRFCLQGNNPTAVGTIIVDKGKVSFEGDADESALIFIEYLVRRNSQQWAELEKHARHYDEFMNVIEAARAALAAGTPVDLESLFNGELASAMFATMFAGEFVRHGAKNYLELSYDVPELGYFTVTTQRKGCKTPGDRIAELEAVVNQRNGECVRLMKERDELLSDQLTKGSNIRAAADVYFQLMEECQIPPGGSLVEYVRELEEQVKTQQRQNPIDHGYRPECECSGGKATARICTELAVNSLVIPNEMTSEQAYEIGYYYGDPVDVFARGANWMRQHIIDSTLAASPQLSSSEPVTVPGKWIPVSERKPDPKSEQRVCAYTPTPHEDIRYRFVPASLFKAVCSDATHWHYMEPPADQQLKPVVPDRYIFEVNVGGNTWVQCSEKAYENAKSKGELTRVLYEYPSAAVFLKG